MTEKLIQAEILRAIGARSDLRVWRNNVGQAWTGKRADQVRQVTTIHVEPGDVVIRNGHPIKFGLPGSADLIGILAPAGRFLAVEVKSETGKQDPQQKLFQAMIQKHGGLYILARSPEEAERAVRGAI